MLGQVWQGHIYLICWILCQQELIGGLLPLTIELLQRSALVCGRVVVNHTLRIEMVAYLLNFGLLVAQRPLHAHLQETNWKLLCVLVMRKELPVVARTWLFLSFVQDVFNCKFRVLNTKWLFIRGLQLFLMLALLRYFDELWLASLVERFSVPRTFTHLYGLLIQKVELIKLDQVQVIN